MPINTQLLYDCLTDHQYRLYNIYVLCNDIQIAEEILRERNYIIKVLEQIKRALHQERNS
jgi:hypothetical protein